MSVVLGILIVLAALFMIVTVLLQSSNAKGLGAIAGEVTANMSKSGHAALPINLSSLFPYPLQCSCLGNPMNRGAWWATVHGVAESWTQLSD